MEEKKTLSLKVLDERLKASDERMDQLEDKIDDMSEHIATSVNESMDKVLASIKAMNQPASIRPDGMLSEDYDYSDDPGGIEFKAGRPEDDVELVERSLHAIDSPEFKEKAEQMRFDMETVIVRVMPSSEQFPDNTFTVSVNGVPRLVVRGIDQPLPRCYVETMLRAKTSTFGNLEYRNDQNELAVKNPESRSARYPCQIIRDPNPKGQRWLERIMSEAA